MATLTQLVDTIAAVEGLERSTVNLVARYVREAGLIATHGRGTSAATMGVRDAANLLIGVNATATGKDAARTVSVYRALVSYEFRAKRDPGPAKKYGTLGEAIEQLVDAAGEGKLPEVFLNREVPDDLQDAFPDVHIDMKFRRPIPFASLKITSTQEHELTPDFNEEGSETKISEGTRVWEVENVAEEVGTETGIPEDFFFEFSPPKLLGPPRRKKTIVGDRLEEVTIGYRTLSSIGELLRPNG
jgi:hypothetical protein